MTQFFRKILFVYSVFFMILSVSPNKINAEPQSFGELYAHNLKQTTASWAASLTFYALCGVSAYCVYRYWFSHASLDGQIKNLQDQVDHLQQDSNLSLTYSEAIDEQVQQVSQKVDYLVQGMQALLNQSRIRNIKVPTEQRDAIQALKAKIKSLKEQREKISADIQPGAHATNTTAVTITSMFLERTTMLKNYVINWWSSR